MINTIAALASDQIALQSELRALLEICRKRKQKRAEKKKREEEEEERLGRLPYFFDEVGLLSGTPAVTVVTGYECRRRFRQKGRWMCERYDGKVVPIGQYDF